jgi:hypothetical protein
MTIRLLTAGLALGVVMAAGCATTGTGYGSSSSGADRMTFSWKSLDNVSGSMTATAADGQTYTGQFFEITSDTQAQNLAPLWVGWGRGWRSSGWADWDQGPEFVTHYSGRVVANLSAAGGAHVRCRFQLAYPSAGMSGGGSGECQLPDGKSIDADFPRA